MHVWINQKACISTQIAKVLIPSGEVTPVPMGSYPILSNKHFIFILFG